MAVCLIWRISEGIEANADCPTPHGTFRDKFNCSQYYTCMFGEIVARYGCATGLSYNDVSSTVAKTSFNQY